MNSALRVFAAFAIGLILGVVAESEAVVKVIEPIGTLWINALRMPIIPLIVALTISGVASVENARQASTLTIRAVMVFLVLLTVFTAIITPLAPILMSGLTLDETSSAALRTGLPAASATATKISFVEWALSLVPVNPIKAAADGGLLPIVIFSLAYGLALTKTGGVVRETQVRLFQGVADTLITLIRGVLFVAPVGVFALSYVLGAKVGTAAVQAVALYIGLVVAAIVFITGCLYLITWLIGGVPLKRFAAALLPAQAIGLSSRSSLAALPAVIEGIRSHLNISQPVISVVLPLAASIFKLSSAAQWSFGAVLISVLYNVPLDATAWLIFGIGTVLLSFTIPGVPSGSFLIQAPLFVTVGLPVEGLGILIAIDLIPDLFKTLLNVTGFGTSAALVERWGANDPKPVANTAAD